MTTHVDLPAGNHAELYEPDEVPRAVAKRYREQLYSKFAPAMGEATADTAPEDVEKAATAAVLAGGMGVLDDLQDALLLAAVVDWSYGPVDAETLAGLPEAAAVAIARAIDPKMADVLTPDFGPSPDDDSPTTRSSA